MNTTELAVHLTDHMVFELWDAGYLTVAPDAPEISKVRDLVDSMLRVGSPLVDEERLASAIPDDLAFWEDAILHGRPKSDLARHILASLSHEPAA